MIDAARPLRRDNRRSSIRRCCASSMVGGGGVGSTFGILGLNRLDIRHSLMFAREFTQGQNNLLQPVAAPCVSLALCL